MPTTPEAMRRAFKEYDHPIEQIAKESYPEVSLLQQMKGVGTQIALTYVLTIEDPHRFRKSRDIQTIRHATSVLWPQREGA